LITNDESRIAELAILSKDTQKVGRKKPRPEPGLSTMKSAGRYGEVFTQPETALDHSHW
jgi:hypothetical protein